MEEERISTRSKIILILLFLLISFTYIGASLYAGPPETFESCIKKCAKVGKNMSAEKDTTDAWKSKIGSSYKMSCKCI